MAILQQTAIQLERSGIETKSLKVGETAPDFSFESSWCEQSTLYQLLETAPVVFNFFRGFWCSYCAVERDVYAQVLSQHQGNKFHYLALTPQQLIDPDIDQAQCHLVIDKNLDIARSFGIAYRPPKAEQAVFETMGLSLTTVNDMPTWELPLPATYVIGQDHKVKFRFVNADYRRRFDPNELVKLAILANRSQRTEANACHNE